MTLRDVAEHTSVWMKIKIIPNYDCINTVNVKSIFILTASIDHNPDIYQYVRDNVEMILPSNSEPDTLHVVVKHAF